MLVQLFRRVVDGDGLPLGTHVLGEGHHVAVRPEATIPSGQAEGLPVQCLHLRESPEGVVGVDQEGRVVQEDDLAVGHVPAPREHLQVRPLAVALGAERAVDLPDGHRDVHSGLDHRAVDEDVRLAEGLVDVLEDPALRLGAILTGELHDPELREGLREPASEVLHLPGALAGDADAEARILRQEFYYVLGDLQPEFLLLPHHPDGLALGLRDVPDVAHGGSREAPQEAQGAVAHVAVQADDLGAEAKELVEEVEGLDRLALHGALVEVSQQGLGLVEDDEVVLRVEGSRQQVVVAPQHHVHQGVQLDDEPGGVPDLGVVGSVQVVPEAEGAEVLRDVPGQRLAVGHEEHPPVALPLDEAPEEVRLAAAVPAPDGEALALLDELPHLPGEDLLTGIAPLAGSRHEVVGLELHAGHLRLALQAGQVHPEAGTELVEELGVPLLRPGHEARDGGARSPQPRPLPGAVAVTVLRRPLTHGVPELQRAAEALEAETELDPRLVVIQPGLREAPAEQLAVVDEILGGLQEGLRVAGNPDRWGSGFINLGR